MNFSLTNMSLVFCRRQFFPTFAIWRNSAPAVQIRKKSKVAVPYPDVDPVFCHGVTQKGTGKIYDKKPFKFFCEKGKEYYWCACGWSHTQPFCDSTHKNSLLKIKMIPVRFVAPESKEYWFCNCKQTSKRPFCDGTHRNQEIQDAIKS